MREIISLKTYKKYLIDSTDCTTDYNLRNFLIHDIGNKKLQNIIDTTSAFSYYTLNNLLKKEEFLKLDIKSKISINIRIINVLLPIQNGTIDWPCDYLLHPTILPRDILVSEYLLRKFFKIKYFDYKKLPPEQVKNVTNITFIKTKEDLEKITSYYGKQEEEEIKRILKL